MRAKPRINRQVAKIASEGLNSTRRVSRRARTSEQYNQPLLLGSIKYSEKVEAGSELGSRLTRPSPESCRTIVINSSSPTWIFILFREFFRELRVEGRLSWMTDKSCSFFSVGKP